MTSQTRRSELLDCIRAVAILLVLLFHIVIEYPRNTLGPIGEWLYRYGFLGVDVFFPLSGYLITLYLIRNNDGRGVWVFFMRRVFRIVPLYLLVIAMYFGAAEIVNEEPGIERAWITVLFLTGWFILIDGRETVPFTITWSLSVEEFAYLICGFTFLWIKRHRVMALFGLVILSMVVRTWLLTEGYGFNVVYYFPPARLDSVFLGSLTAIAVTRGFHKMVLGLGIAALAVSVPLSYTSLLAFQIVLFPAIAVGVCLCITLAEVYAKGFTSFPTRWIGRFGFYAYFLYLFHYFIIYGLQLVLSKLGIEFQPLALALATLAIVTPCAVLSWRLFEAPLIRYGRLLEKRPADQKS